MVDRVDDEMLEGIRDAVEDLLVQLDVLADEDQLRLLTGVGRNVADDARKTGDDATDGHHRQAHRTVANLGQPTVCAIDQLAQIAGCVQELVTDAEQPVECEGSFSVERADTGLAQHAQPFRLFAREHVELRACALHPASVELRLAHDVEQLVDLVRGDAHGITRPDPAGVLVVIDMQLRHPLRHVHGVDALEHLAQRIRERGQMLVGHRVVHPGHRRGDAIARRQ